MPRYLSVTYRCDTCGREEVLRHSGSLRERDAAMRAWNWLVLRGGRTVRCPSHKD